MGFLFTAIGVLGSARWPAASTPPGKPPALLGQKKARFRATGGLEGPRQPQVDGHELMLRPSLEGMDWAVGHQFLAPCRCPLGSAPWPGSFGRPTWRGIVSKNIRASAAIRRSSAQAKFPESTWHAFSSNHSSRTLRRCAKARWIRDLQEGRCSRRLWSRIVGPAVIRLGPAASTEAVGRSS